MPDGIQSPHRRRNHDTLDLRTGIHPHILEEQTEPPGFITHPALLALLKMPKVAFTAGLMSSAETSVEFDGPCSWELFYEPSGSAAVKVTGEAV